MDRSRLDASKHTFTGVKEESERVRDFLNADCTRIRWIDDSESSLVRITKPVCSYAGVCLSGRQEKGNQLFPMMSG